MTANKHLKRRVRERAGRTGESYTAALRHLRHLAAREHAMQWQRIEKTDFGYAVRIPQSWDERPPNLKNSPWETARFADDSDRRHSMIVFRQPIRPGRTSVEIAELARPSLERAGFTDFQVTEGTLAGLPATLLRCARHDAGRVWAVTEYIVARDEVGFCLGCGSSVPEQDEDLFAGIADRFELLAAAE